MSDANPRVLPGGFRLTVLDEIGSTNDELRRLAEEGAPHGLAIAARRQTAGRGRRGRRWVSPEGNLHLSVLLRPETHARDAAQIAFVMARAMGETLIPLLPGGVRLQYKWPNDILLNKAKACGLLLESGGTGGAIDFVVAGIGLNIAAHPFDTPYPATSLAALGCTGVSPDSILPMFLERLAEGWDAWRLNGFAPVRDAWLERAAGLGEAIEVRLERQTLRGVFEALDETGALMLRDEMGAIRAVTAGDVFFPAHEGSSHAAHD